MWHVWGQKKCVQDFRAENYGKKPFGRSSVDGIIILNGRKKVERKDVVWMNEIGKSGRLFKLGNAYIGFKKRTEFLS